MIYIYIYAELNLKGVKLLRSELSRRGKLNDLENSRMQRVNRPRHEGQIIDSAVSILMPGFSCDK